jgi:hypothetical protein
MIKNVNLTEGKIRSALVKLALPIMGTSFIQMAYNLTDIMWLGRLSTDAVAAAGAAGYFLWLGSALVMVAQVGVGVHVAQSYGRGDLEGAKKYIDNGFQLNWYSESDARLRGYEIKRDISDRFDDEYKKLGLKREDITSEFLSQADSIEEIKINVVKTNGFSEFLNKEDYNININGIEFYDENLRRYYVINKVIEDYNVKNLKQLLLRRV